MRDFTDEEQAFVEREILPMIKSNRRVRVLNAEHLARKVQRDYMTKYRLDDLTDTFIMWSKMTVDELMDHVFSLRQSLDEIYNKTGENPTLTEKTLVIGQNDILFYIEDYTQKRMSQHYLCLNFSTDPT